MCFGKFSIDSAEGCQQGDPLGPLYFCLSIHKLLTSFKSEFVVGYLDDLTIGDHVDKAIEDFLILDAEASKLGLHLNRSKCEIIGISDLSRTQLKEKGILLNETESAAACLLGSPLHMDGISQAIINKRSDLKIMSTRLSYMPAHDSLFLLKNALAIPKLMYILRSSPCFDNDELINYDNDLRNMLSKILNIDLSDDGWEQASLPVRCGGLGIRSAVSLAPSAYLASAAGSASLVNHLLPSYVLTKEDPYIPSATKSWENIGGTSVIAPHGPAMLRQKSWDRPCCQSIAAKLLSKCASSSDRARLLASQSSGSGAWLEALPLTSIGLKLDDTSLAIAASLRIGAPVVFAHTCVCGARVERDGHHGLSCKRSAGRHMRHSNVNEIIQRAFHTAGIATIREPTGVFVDDRRPDGITLLPQKKGKCLAWDFTCPDTVAPSHRNSTERVAGAAAVSAEATKFAKYVDLNKSYDLVPIAIETFGSWGQHGWELVEWVGSKIAQSTGELRATTFLRQRISIAIQRGNAASVLGTQRHFLST